MKLAASGLPAFLSATAADMKTHLLLPILILGGLSAPVHAEDFFTPVNPARAGEERALYGYAQGFYSNDIVPVSQENKDWSIGYRPRSGTNVTLESINYEAGVQWQGYRLGYVYRSDWLLTESRDTADFIRANRQQANFDPGRTYDFAYHLSGFTADGARLTKSFSNSLDSGWTFAWGGAASLLRGRGFQQADITGNPVAAAGAPSRNFSATYDWKWDNSNASSLTEAFGSNFAAANKPSGIGYSFDVGISIARDDGLRFEWVASDAFGRMKWNDIPEQRATLIVINGSTLVSTPPAAQVNLTENLPVKHSLSLSVPTRIADVELSDTIYQGINMPRLGLSKRFNADWSARADYDVRFATVGLGVTIGSLYLNLRSDSLNLKKAHAYGATIGARLDF